ARARRMRVVQRRHHRLHRRLDAPPLRHGDAPGLIVVAEGPTPSVGTARTRTRRQPGNARLSALKTSAARATPVSAPWPSTTHVFAATASPPAKLSMPV